MNPLNESVANELQQHGIEFIHFVDVSGLAEKQNRGFSSAVLFGVKCSPEYLKRVSGNPNYVSDMVARNYFDDDEHYTHEMGMYRISDLLAEFIERNDYRAYSLSDNNQIATNNFDGNKSMLPLKTLAIHARRGWIGKNNLLVNKEYGCAQVWGAVLTDAPLNTDSNNPLAVQCGNCRICLDFCEPVALKGTVWQPGMEREEMIEVEKCTTCLKCMVHCPWTQRYMKREEGNDMAMHEIRKVSTGNYGSKITNLVMNVFLEYEAPEYSQEGIDTFSAYVNDENIMRKLDMYGAFVDDNIVGILAARNEGRHISLFFVDGKYHRKGIGRMLFSAFIKDNPAKVITVNSSPYAVEVYRRLGFVDTDTEQIQDGLRYIPMKYRKPELL